MIFDIDIKKTIPNLIKYMLNFFFHIYIIKRLKEGSDFKIRKPDTQEESYSANNIYC